MSAHPLKLSFRSCALLAGLMLGAAGSLQAQGEALIPEQYTLQWLATVPDECTSIGPHSPYVVSNNGRFLVGSVWEDRNGAPCGKVRSTLRMRTPEPDRVKTFKQVKDQQKWVHSVSSDGRSGGSVEGFSTQAFVTGPLGRGEYPVVFADSIWAKANAVNRQGQVAGTYRLSLGTSRAFVADPGNAYVARDLGTLGGQESWAWGINERGQVVGSSLTDLGSFKPHAFLTQPNGQSLMDLGSIGPYGSVAYAVNRTGQVTGIGYFDPTLTGLVKGFVTDDNGKNPRWIEPLPGTSGTSAVGPNVHGQVVGLGWVKVGLYSETRAIVTGRHGVGTFNLDERVQLPSGLHLRFASSISDDGDIVAFATDATGTRGHWYLLCKAPNCQP
ncbi:hypothetical protein [Ideonella sp.]|uniref:hypothetical protein n=1 Tax=Ideonella sp. TaxID=1929293 RepID=UPI0037C04623